MYDTYAEGEEREIAELLEERARLVRLYEVTKDPAVLRTIKEIDKSIAAVRRGKAFGTLWLKSKTWFADTSAPREIYLNQTAPIQGRLMSKFGIGSEKPIKGYPVYLVVDGEERTSTKTGGNGEFRFTLLGSDVGSGSHEVFVRYKGTRLSNPCESPHFTITVIRGIGTPGEVQPKPVIDWKKTLLPIAIAGGIAVVAAIVISRMLKRR